MKSSSFLRPLSAITFPAVLLLSAGCHHHINDGSAAGNQYIPLSDYKYTPAKVDSGAPMQILAIIQPPDNDKNTIYYSQFIAINKTNGDTVRVLSTLISYDTPGGETPHTYSPASAYNGDKKILEATFMPADSNQTFMLNATLETDNLKDGAIKPEDLDKQTRREMLVINNSVPIVASPSYKAIIGVLNFKETPL